MKSTKKLIIFSNEDKHFAAHLMPIAISARDNGYTVQVVTRVMTSAHEVESKGIELIPIRMHRFSFNPFKELAVIYKLIGIYARQKPDIVHHFGIKPVLYGSIASLLLPGIRVVNTFLGMGFTFISDKLVVKVLRAAVIQFLRVYMRRKNTLLTVENSDDRQMLLDYKIASPSSIRAQCSVGVDMKEFHNSINKRGKTPVFALVGRMIEDKGIKEFVEAARIIRNKGLSAEFWLVGEPDNGNPRSITKEQLKEWNEEGVIMWKGFCQDIAEIWAKVHVAALPSYREGLSRSLLEAAASGCALITTNAPGCRELVHDGIDGLLVSVKDSVGLASAMERLIIDPGMLASLAKAALENVANNYSSDVVVGRVLGMYSELLE